jgi:hypothetical protein
MIFPVTNDDTVVYSFKVRHPGHCLPGTGIFFVSVRIL